MDFQIAKPSNLLFSYHQIKTSMQRELVLLSFLKQQREGGWLVFTEVSFCFKISFIMSLNCDFFFFF